MAIAGFTSFTYSEPIKHPRWLKGVDPSILITPNTSSYVKLFRLLIGTADFIHSLSGKKIHQRENLSITYGDRDLIIVNKIVCKKLIKQWVEPEISLEDLVKFAGDHRKPNEKVWKEVLSDFSWYFYYKGMNSPTVAFLYLYRVCEYISYSFPMIYAGAANDFMGTYGKLKAFFGEGGKRELGFFDTFSSSFLDSIVLEQDLTIETAAPNQELREKYFKILKNKLINKIEREDEPNSITIKYKDFWGFIIEIRNRYFHFLTNHTGNISSMNLEPDSFFEQINDLVANWLAFITLEIMKARISPR